MSKDSNKDLDKYMIKAFKKIYTKPKKKKEYRESTNLVNITGKLRKFDQDLFNKFDVSARELVKKILGDHVEDNPDEYGEDMIFKDKKFYYKYIELQVCGTWKENEKFPFKYPYVYERKMRFSENTLFLTFDRNLTRVILFSRKNINNECARLKKYDREYVNYVPWRFCIQVDVEDLDMDLIKNHCGQRIVKN